MKKILLLILMVVVARQAAALEIANYDQTEHGYASGTIGIMGIAGMSGDLIVEIGINGGEKLAFDISRTSEDVVTATISDGRYIENDTFIVVSSMGGAERRLRMFKVLGGQQIAKRKRLRKVTENNQHPEILSLKEGETVEVEYSPPAITNDDDTVSIKPSIEKTAKSIATEDQPPSVEPEIGAEYSKTSTGLTILITKGRKMETVGEYVSVYADAFNYKLVQMPGDERVYSLPLDDAVNEIEDLYWSTGGAVRHIIFHNHTNPKLMRILPSHTAQKGFSNEETVSLDKGTTKPKPTSLPGKATDDKAPEPQTKTIQELLQQLPKTAGLSLIIMPGDDTVLKTNVLLDEPIASIEELYAVTKGTIKHVVITPHNYRVIGEYHD